MPGAPRTPTQPPRTRRRLPLSPSTGSQVRGRALDAPVRQVDRRAHPVHAVWELTLACDLACHHCGSRAGHARPDELDLGEALSMVRQLAELGVREVTLIGGEAYLYPHWLEVARAVRENGMACAMVSGGRGLDRERARQAREAGIQSVSISLDGDETVHDALRALEGSYRAARAALDHCRAEGLPVALNSQINRRNMHCLEHLGEVLFEVEGHGWQLILTVPAGRGADEADLILQPYDLLTLFPRLATLQARCVARGIKFLPGNNVGYFGPYQRQLRDALGCSSQGHCAAGRSVIGIEANGDIKGCPSLPTRGWVGGNFRDHDLATIWERAPELRFTRDRDGSELWGYCAQCYYAQECKAGCTWTSTSLLGRPGNNPYCHHRALEFERRGERETVTLEREAPGESFDHGVWSVRVEPLPIQERT